jgi:hypothetical protein
MLHVEALCGVAGVIVFMLIAAIRMPRVAQPT